MNTMELRLILERESTPLRLLRVASHSLRRLVIQVT